MRASRHMLQGLLGPTPLTPGVVAENAVRIMGIGDSLTAGIDAENHAYRPALLRRMGELGHAIQFVGDYDGSEETTDGWTWDNWYNAQGGRIVATIDTSMPAGMQQGYPEIAVLCAGANDINGNADEATTVALVATLIDEILTWPQLRHLFVCDITLNTGDTAECILFNSLLEAEVATYGANVHWVEVFAAAELVDHVHPTDAAYELIGEGLAEAIAEVLPLTPLADNSPIKFRATPGDWWLSTRSITGDAIGSIYEDAAWSDVAEDGDTVATLTDLIHKYQWADSPTGPTYDADGGDGEPVLDFRAGVAVTDVLEMGSPCTLFMVGEFDSGDSNGWAIQWNTGGAVRVPWASETSGAPVGMGFYDGAYKSFNAGGAEFGEFACFAVVFAEDGFARLYKNGVQLGDSVAYTSWGGSSSFVVIGGQTAQIEFSDSAHIGAELSPANFAALNAWLMARNNL